MKNIVICIVIAVTIAGCSAPQPPVPKKAAREFVEFGHKRIDEYYWMNNPSDSLVIAHLRAENAYTQAMLKHTEGLQQTIYDELVARIEQKYESLPTRQNGYWYNIRYEEGKQYPLYCRRKGDRSAAEEIYLDVPSLAAGHQIYMVRGTAVSPSNTLLAYGIDTTGGRRCLLSIKNLAT